MYRIVIFLAAIHNTIFKPYHTSLVFKHNLLCLIPNFIDLLYNMDQYGVFKLCQDLMVAYYYDIT